MIWIVLFVLLSIIYCEKKFHKTLITPASMMAISYIITILAAKIGNIYFNYFPISSRVYFIVLVSIGFAWIPSFIVPKQNDKKSDIEMKFQLSFCNKVYLFLLEIGLLIGLIFKLRNGAIASTSFEDNYMHGPFAHLLNLFCVITMFAMCFSEKNIYTISIIGFGFFLVFLSGVKYHVIFMFLTYVIKILYLGKRKDYIRIGLICFLGVFFIFFMNYFLSFLIRGIKSDKFFIFIINHFLMYISGGLVAFSELLRGNGGVKSGFVSIDTVGINSTNVYSLIGELYLKHSVFSFINIFIISLIGYILFYYFIKQRNILNKQLLFIAYTIFSGVPLLLSFFGSYYGLLRTFELPILALICCILLQKNFGKKFLLMGR